MLQPHKPDLPLCCLACEVPHAISLLMTIFMKKYFSNIGIKSTGRHPLTEESISSYSKQCGGHMEYIGPCYSTIYCLWNDSFIVFIILYTGFFYLYFILYVDVYKMIPGKIFFFNSLIALYQSLHLKWLQHEVFELFCTIM